MRIVGHFEGHFIKADCCVRGCLFGLGCSGDDEDNYGISYDLYTDAGEHLGCVCYDCIQPPVETIKAQRCTCARTVLVSRPEHAAAVQAMTEELITREWIPHVDIPASTSIEEVRDGPDVDHGPDVQPYRRRN